MTLSAWMHVTGVSVWLVASPLAAYSTMVTPGQGWRRVSVYLPPGRESTWLEFIVTAAPQAGARVHITGLQAEFGGLSGWRWGGGCPEVLIRSLSDSHRRHARRGVELELEEVL